MAVNQSSPGVVIQERDLTTITTLSTANIGVLAAPFESGPVEEIVQISSERELVERFGNPNDKNYEYWYTASQFLSYGGTLKTIRVTNSTLKNAVSNDTAELIKNLQDYETNHTSQNWHWAARTAGTKGNSIGIFVTDAGADQIITLDEPTGSAGSAKEYRFTAGESLAGATFTAGGGLSGRVVTYRYRCTVSGTPDITPVPGTNVHILDTVNNGIDREFVINAYDAANKIVELAPLDVDDVGKLIDSSVFYDSDATNNSARKQSFAVSAISRELVVSLDEGSREVATTDTLTDNYGGTDDPYINATVDITAVRSEYADREYLPGLKWNAVAARPGTSNYASTVGGYHDELHILVIDVDGGITGTTGAVLERFIGLSKASDAKTTVGETNYYKEVIKQRSNYVFWGAHEDQVHAVGASGSAGDWGKTSSTTFNIIKFTGGTQSYPAGATTIGSVNGATVYYRLVGGVDYAGADSYTITNTDVINAYELVEDPESQAVDFILTGPSGADDAAALAKITALTNIVEERRDCMLFVSPRRANVVGVSNATTAADNLIAFFDTLPSSSYVVFDSGYKYIYDKYNDVYRYVPCNGDVAGLCLQTTEVSEPWFSPAGFQRGILRNAIKLAYSPNKTQRERLYAARINPIVSFPGQGVVLFGDKTALGFASAFDRINVRRLFLTIERVIGTAAKSQLFEQNDEAQRSLFLNIVEPYMRDVQGRRGVTDFLVKCDSENNPPEAVDRGEFYAEIYVKPTRTINYITLTFTATRTGVAFGEIAS
jgi:hypothetical protein